MPSSYPLYHTALMESPGGRKAWVKDLHEIDNDAMTTMELTSHSTALARTHGCGGGGGDTGVLACLRKLNATALRAAPLGRFAPATDGHLVLGIPLHQVRAGAWNKDVAVVVGSCSCESCGGGPPAIPARRSLTEAEYAAALNATYSPARFLPFRVDLTPGKVAGWYAAYAAKRGRWEALARIASDGGHACTAHFFAEALAATGAGTVHRYEFRAAARPPRTPRPHGLPLPAACCAANGVDCAK
jgi:hypothetical protein